MEKIVIIAIVACLAFMPMPGSGIQVRGVVGLQWDTFEYTRNRGDVHPDEIGIGPEEMSKLLPSSAREKPLSWAQLRAIMKALLESGDIARVCYADIEYLLNPDHPASSYAEDLQEWRKNGRGFDRILSLTGPGWNAWVCEAADPVTITIKIYEYIS